MHRSQLPEFTLHPYPVHLQLSFSVDDQPPVDAQLLYSEQRMLEVRLVLWVQ